MPEVLNLTPAELERERADRAEAELAGLADRIGSVVAAAGAAERDRAERAEAAADAAREVLTSFLAEYGDSELPLFGVAQDLARSVAKTLDLGLPGGALAALQGRAAAAEAEAGRLRALLEEREREATDRILTPGEVAAIFHVDRKTVTRWAKAGKLTPIVTAGNHRRYRGADVEALRRERGRMAAGGTRRG